MNLGHDFVGLYTFFRLRWQQDTSYRLYRMAAYVIVTALVNVEEMDSVEDAPLSSTLEGQG